MKRTLSNRLAELKKQGFIVDRIRGGKHAKTDAVAPDGWPLMVVVGVTPSDHRAPRNFAALLRRFARPEN